MHEIYVDFNTVVGPVKPMHAVGNGVYGIMLTNYDEADDAPTRSVSLHINGCQGSTVQIYQLDHERDMELLRTVPFTDTFYAGRSVA